MIYWDVRRKFVQSIDWTILLKNTCMMNNQTVSVLVIFDLWMFLSYLECAVLKFVLVYFVHETAIIGMQHLSKQTTVRKSVSNIQDDPSSTSQKPLVL